MENCGGDTFEKLEKYLYALRNAGSKFSLERIKKLCEKLGNPQAKYPSIHVAGTNGKGSTCAMLESILRGGGLKTGMYTSPHLLYLGERIQINRAPISKAALSARIAEVRNACGELFDEADIANYPSFFEIMTAAAFLHFAEEKVDAAVVEVGLGGRLDSTNVINPACSVITTIGLDHTEYLGSTIAAIAAEKAGIIKQNTPVVAGFLPPEAMEVVRKNAEEKCAPLLSAADYYGSESSMPQTSLEGSYQRRNAAVAELCAKTLAKTNAAFSALTDAEISRALSNVQWAARWQKIPLKNSATLILDASHNPEGAAALEENLKKLVKTSGKPVITVGVLGEQRAKALLPVVAKYARKIAFFVPNEPRALGFEALEKLTPASVETMRANVGDIYHDGLCELVRTGETVVSTGSIYLAGEILSALGGKKSDGLSDLI